MPMETRIVTRSTPNIEAMVEACPSDLGFYQVYDRETKKWKTLIEPSPAAIIDSVLGCEKVRLRFLGMDRLQLGREDSHFRRTVVEIENREAESHGHVAWVLLGWWCCPPDTGQATTWLPCSEVAARGWDALIDKKWCKIVSPPVAPPPRQGPILPPPRTTFREALLSMVGLAEPPADAQHRLNQIDLSAYTHKWARWAPVIDLFEKEEESSSDYHLVCHDRSRGYGGPGCGVVLLERRGARRPIAHFWSFGYRTQKVWLYKAFTEESALGFNSTHDNYLFYDADSEWAGLAEGLVEIVRKALNELNSRLIEDPSELLETLKNPPWGVIERNARWLERSSFLRSILSDLTREGLITAASWVWGGSGTILRVRMPNGEVGTLFSMHSKYAQFYGTGRYSYAGSPLRAVKDLRYYWPGNEDERGIKTYIRDILSEEDGVS